jgi:hypothetical protein
VRRDGPEAENVAQPDCCDNLRNVIRKLQIDWREQVKLRIVIEALP